MFPVHGMKKIRVGRLVKTVCFLLLLFVLKKRQGAALVAKRYFWARQAGPKFDLPLRHFYLPRRYIKQRWDWTLPKTLLVYQFAPLPFFAEPTCNLQRGQWLCCTLNVFHACFMSIGSWKGRKNLGFFFWVKICWGRVTGNKLHFFRPKGHYQKTLWHLKMDDFNCKLPTV